MAVCSDGSKQLSHYSHYTLLRFFLPSSKEIVVIKKNINDRQFIQDGKATHLKTDNTYLIIKPISFFKLKIKGVKTTRITG